MRPPLAHGCSRPQDHVPAPGCNQGRLVFCTPVPYLCRPFLFPFLPHRRFGRWRQHPSTLRTSRQALGINVSRVNSLSHAAPLHCPCWCPVFAVITLATRPLLFPSFPRGCRPAPRPPATPAGASSAITESDAATRPLECGCSLVLQAQSTPEECTSQRGRCTIDCFVPRLQQLPSFNSCYCRCHPKPVQSTGNPRSTLDLHVHISRV
jgi:hypothetical protein